MKQIFTVINRKKCKNVQINSFVHDGEETGRLLSPLCAGAVSDDDGEYEEAMGSCSSTPCAGTSRVVMETDEEEEGGPQTLSLTRVPGVSSTSP